MMSEKEKHSQNNPGRSSVGDKLDKNPPFEPGEINVDDNVSGTSHLNDEIMEESLVEKLQLELQEMKDKYLRLVAEFDNFKKRTARERLELIQTANKEVIISLLDVLDDSDRAIQQLEVSQDLKAIKDGIMLVFNKLKSTLLSKGLKEMDSHHTDFNVDLHEAITEIKSPDENLKGKVVDTLQKGYYLQDKIIRHAKVVVGK
ncbi:MAG: nucleotide exchange factor GrpE [Chitinophagaceae bacterium]